MSAGIQRIAPFGNIIIAGLKTDGSLTRGTDPDTTAKIKAFQSALNTYRARCDQSLPQLTVDGIIGPRTVRVANTVIKKTGRFKGRTALQQFNSQQLGEIVTSTTITADVTKLAAACAAAGAGKSASSAMGDEEGWSTGTKVLVGASALVGVVGIVKLVQRRRSLAGLGDEDCGCGI